MRCRFLDISRNGLRFALYHAIPVGTEVRIGLPDVGLRVKAIVRHVEKVDELYHVGVEFQEIDRSQFTVEAPGGDFMDSSSRPL